MSIAREISFETLAAVALPFLILLLAAIGGNAIQHRLVWSGESLIPRLRRGAPLPVSVPRAGHQ